MTNEERLAYLLEIVETPTNALVTIGGIREALTPEAYGMVLATFAVAKIPQSKDLVAIAQAAEMEASFIAMSGGGLSLSSSTRQAIIDTLAVAGSWPNPVRDAVKALGVTRRARWQTLPEYSAQPTIQTMMIESAIQAIRTKLNNASASLGSEYTDSLTVAELETRIAAVIASADGLVP